RRTRGRHFPRGTATGDGGPGAFSRPRHPPRHGEVERGATARVPVLTVHAARPRFGCGLVRAAARARAALARTYQVDVSTERERGGVMPGDCTWANWQTSIAWPDDFPRAAKVCLTAIFDLVLPTLEEVAKSI